MLATSELTVQGLHLFKSLIKDGCEWQGDVCSSKWSECLYYTADKWPAVSRTLIAYEVGVHFQVEGDEAGGCVWVY